MTRVYTDDVEVYAVGMAEEPYHFTWRGRTYDVLAIRRYRSTSTVGWPGGWRFWTVDAADGGESAVFELRHDPDDQWHLSTSTNGPAEFSDEAALSSTATDCQESEAMSNPSEVPHADTRQGRQMTAAIAIAKMCEHQLPEIAAWRIDVNEDPAIEGLLSHCGDLVAKLADWRLYLKAGEPRVVAYTASDSGRVEVIGSYHGPAGEVRVRIWHGVTAEKLAELNAEREAS